MRYGVVFCQERGADCLHMVRLIPLHPKFQHLFPHLNPDKFYLAYPGCNGKQVKTEYSSSQDASLLRELTCHMGSQVLPATRQR